MVSRCAAVMMAAAVVADVVQPLPVDLRALDGDASEMPECSVSLLQTRMEKMRKSQVSVEANSKVDGAEQASKAMKEMGDAITSLFSSDKVKQGELKGAVSIKERAALQSTAIGKASHAIEDVKQAFSKLLAQEEVKVQAGKEKEQKEKESKQADSVSFTQEQDARIGHSSTFDVEAAAEFWDDVADVKGGTGAQQGVSAKASLASTSNTELGIDIWNDDWKAASNAGSLDVTQSATDGSYLSHSNYLQAALEGQHVEQKSKADDEPEQKVVLSWGPDKEPSKNSLLSAKTGGFPSLMSKEHKEDKHEDEESISSKKFETSDEQVVKAFIGGNVAQNSKSIQSILGDMMLSPDDQGMFSVPQEEKKTEGAHDQNQTSLATGDQSKSDAQNQTALATKDEDKSEVRNKTSLASVGSAIKSVITSVENSSWPWSKNTKPAESTGEVLAKDVSNSTKAANQDMSDANKTIETKTSTNDTVSERSNNTATKEDTAKIAANATVLEKSNNTASKEDAAIVNKTVLESSNKTKRQEGTAPGTKTNQTSGTKASVNDTSAGVAVSNSTDKK